MKELKIRKPTLEKYNGLMGRDNIDTDKIKANSSGIVKSWHIEFGDDVDAWLDVVLYNDYLLCSVTWYKGAVSFQFSDERSTLDGEWVCNGNPEYSFKVI